MNGIKNILACSLLILLFNSPPSFAEIGRKTPSSDGSLSAGPYYNPASKSYFELFRAPKIQGERRWEIAKARAERKYFKNTRGRLAVIKNLATHQFILHNFKGNNIWIGLQYLCGNKVLKWVDGTYIKKSDFSAWGPNWARRPDIRCADMGYMPVAYTRSQSTYGATRWQATGPHKGYVLYLVEYPTGKK